MATASNDIDDIRRKMAKIRRELHEDVREVVEKAEAVSDWRHYVKMYPWAAVGVAAALGYFLVPKRKKSSGVKATEIAQAVAAITPQNLAPQALAAVAPAAPKKGRSLISAGLGMLAPIALRAAQNYATHFVSNWVAQQQDQVAAMMAATGLVPQPGSPMPGSGGPKPGQSIHPGQPGRN